MQYPNNDMDELFRKAAEAYPLNTGAANWEKVQAALAGEEKKERPGKGNLRWIVVVMPFLFIGLHLNKALLTSRTKFTPAETITQSRVVTESKADPTGDKMTPRLVTTGFVSTPKPIQHKPDDKAVLRFQPFQPATVQTYQQPAGNNTVFDDETTALTPPLVEAALTPTSVGTAGVDHSLAGSDLGERIKSNVSNDSLLVDLPAPDTRKKETDRSFKKRFYAGLVGGPDISTVKFQRFSNLGFQAGVLLGYALNDRLAVEVGALSSKKHYYSDGAHYKSDGYYAPSYAKLLAVDGNCRMIELPLALRYTVSRQKRGALFATAGVSSYIMQREDYNLDYLYPSSGNIATHKHSYTDKDQYWLATLQLSFGYSTKLGSLGNLRLEPYYALPLKGMGHGRLPVSSFGLRFGITFPQF